MAVCIYSRLVPDLVLPPWWAHKVTRLVPDLVLARGCAQRAHKDDTHKVRTRTHKVRTRVRTRSTPTLCKS